MKVNKKKVLKNLLVLSLAAIPFNKVMAENINANEWDIFKNRTKEEIQQEFKKANENGSYVNNDSKTYYAEEFSLTAPYKAGTLTEDTHNTMTNMTNYYRWLVGVDGLTAPSTNRDDLQAGALIRNYDFNHVVSSDKKPADMDTDLWNLGANASHNILAWNYTPKGAITGWLNEGYSLRTNSFDTTGHRDSLIAPSVSKLQFGYAGSIAIGEVLESKNKTDLDYVAFPVPGYMPNNILNVNSSAWEVYLNNSQVKVTDAKKVTVKVTNNKTKESYDCTVDNGKLQASASKLIFVQPSSSKNTYDADSEYTVEATGLVNENNEDSTISYTVNFFDVTASTETTDKNDEPSNSETNKPTTDEEEKKEETDNKEENNNQDEDKKEPTANTLKAEDVVLESEKPFDGRYTLDVKKLEKTPEELAKLEIEDLTYIETYDISVLEDGKIVEMKDGNFTIKIPYENNYDSYQVAYIKDGEIAEKIDAKYVDGYVEFTTTHLSEYAIYGKKQASSNVSVINPQTSDNIMKMIVLFVVALGGLLVSFWKFSQKNKKND